MSNNLLLAAAIGAAVFLVVKKQAVAAPMSSNGTKYFASDKGKQQSTAINADMWTRLLGSGWSALASGSAAIGKNALGQQVSSDGKPINGGDPLSFYYQLLAGDPVELPANFGGSVLPSGAVSSPVMDWYDGGGYDWEDIRGLA